VITDLESHNQTKTNNTENGNASRVFASVRNNTNSSSPLRISVNSAYAVSAGHKKRSRRYVLLGHAQKLLISADVKQHRKWKQSENLDKPLFAHRTTWCSSVSSRDATMTIKLNHNQEASSASLSNTIRCGSVWACPICAARIALERGDEVARAIDWATSQKLVPIMITLTAAHHADLSLEYFKQQFTYAWRLFTSGKAWLNLKQQLGIKHWIKAVEPLRSQEHGWHYHAHVLLLLDADIFKPWHPPLLPFIPPGWHPPFTYDATCLELVLRAAWLKKLETAGLYGNEHALKLSADESVKPHYLAKLGLRQDEKGKLEYELTATQNKDIQAGYTVWQLLESSLKGNQVAAALYLEYVRAMSGDMWITWSRGLKQLVGLDEVEDEQLAALEEEEQLETWYELSADEVYAMRFARAQAAVLDVAAASRDISVLKRFLSGLYEYVRSHDSPPPDLEQVRRELSMAVNNWRLASRSLRRHERDGTAQTAAAYHVIENERTMRLEIARLEAAYERLLSMYLGDFWELSICE
jgi:hypothetical protein